MLIATHPLSGEITIPYAMLIILTVRLLSNGDINESVRIINLDRMEVITQFKCLHNRCTFLLNDSKYEVITMKHIIYILLLNKIKRIQTYIFATSAYVVSV